MTEADRSRYLALLQSFYGGSKLSEPELDELTRLYAANVIRVGKITTESSESKT